MVSIIETGKLEATSSWIRCCKIGKVYAFTVQRNKLQFAQADFLPLTVDYREKFASAGRYPEFFSKERARPSDGEICQ